jgi:mannosyltransferase OCH1-like enzyme
MRDRELPTKSIEKYMRKVDNFKDLDQYVGCHNYFVSWKTFHLTRSHFKDYVNFINSNPEFNFFMFNNSTQDKWMEEFIAIENPDIYKIYQGCVYAATKSDIFRLLLLYKYGGIYSGINIIYDRPLISIVQPDKFVCSFEKNKYNLPNYSNYFPHQHRGFFAIQHTLMAPSEHKLLKMCIDKIIDNSHFYKNRNFKEIPKILWDFSAPGMLTQVLNNYLELHGTQDIVFAGTGFYNSFRYATGHKYRYMFSPSYHGARNSKVLKLKDN